MIIRTSVAKVLLEYDISYAPSEDGSAFENKARTNFVTQPGPLHLRFHKRKSEDKGSTHESPAPHTTEIKKNEN